jgi:hypothetical protein
VVAEAVNVRVGPSRILIPDVVVTNHRGNALVLDATTVTLVAEIVSPTTTSMDRVLKPKLYAAAGIGSYLRVELDAAGSPELISYLLSDGRYEKHGRAQPPQTLRLPAPFDVEIDPGYAAGSLCG